MTASVRASAAPLPAGRLCAPSASASPVVIFVDALETRRPTPPAFPSQAKKNIHSSGAPPNPSLPANDTPVACHCATQTPHGARLFAHSPTPSPALLFAARRRRLNRLCSLSTEFTRPPPSLRRLPCLPHSSAGRLANTKRICHLPPFVIACHPRQIHDSRVQCLLNCSVATGRRHPRLRPFQLRACLLALISAPYRQASSLQSAPSSTGFSSTFASCCSCATRPQSQSALQRFSVSGVPLQHRVIRPPRRPSCLLRSYAPPTPVAYCCASPLSPVGLITAFE